MRAALWLLAAAAPLAAQPKLLNNPAQDTRPAAGGLESAFQNLVAADAQPAWIGYEVPAAHGIRLGCEYISGDAENAPGVVHLEPPTTVLVLFRVENKAVTRVRSLSPYCTIDTGGLPLHWISGVEPAQSVALLARFTAADEAVARGAVAAVAMHAGAEAEAALEQWVAPDRPEWLRQRVVSWLGVARGQRGLEMLQRVIAADPSPSVRRRAVSALGSAPDHAGVPALIELARTTRDAELRKQAMQVLGRSRDPRAMALFEEILKR